MFAAFQATGHDGKPEHRAVATGLPIDGEI
jgi:hypothetical protein